MKRSLLLAALLGTLALGACAPAIPPGTAMVVNGQAEPMHLYNVLLAAARQAGQSGNGPVLTDSALKADRQRALEAGALRNLAEDAMVEQLAAARHIKVSQAEVAARLGQLEAAAGGAAGLDRYIAARGVTRNDYVAFLRIRLLEQKLGSPDPMHEKALIDSALRHASIEAFVGPCAQSHDYPACAGS